MPWLIVVTGRPAAGKSTLATWLGKRLALPVASKDGIKEVLFDQLGWRDREWSKTLGRASVALMYHFARTQLQVGRSVILDNAFHPALASPELRALASQYRANTLQIICETTSDVLFERFKGRAESGERHAGHVDVQSLDELRASLAQERPLRLDIGGEVLHVDTTDLANLRYEPILDRVVAIMDSVD
jgi:predicted kinase